ncbi:hypothetical protein HQN90_09450 [Paenibacillus alba]|nr:hypothetical protein [Paenibacillus alba]
MCEALKAKGITPIYEPGKAEWHQEIWLNTMAYSTFSNEVLAKFPNSKADTWKMFPVPLADNKTWSISSGGIVRSINKNSKVIDAAKAYFNFLAKPEWNRFGYGKRGTVLQFRSCWPIYSRFISGRKNAETSTSNDQRGSQQDV